MRAFPHFPGCAEDWVIGFWSDESGATGAEYALLLAIIGVGLAAASTTLGTAITNSFNNISDCVNAGLSCTP